MLARRALATTPRSWYYVRSVAWIYLAVAYQMTGRLDLAYAALAEGQPEDVAANGDVHARVAGSRCFIEWMAGDLQAMKQGAAYLLTVGETHQRRESLAWAHYLLSCVSYHRNDLATAEAHIRALEAMRYVARPMSYVHSAFMQVLIYQARGQSDQARQKLDQIFDFLRETRNEGLVPLAQAYQAELAVMQGDLESSQALGNDDCTFYAFHLNGVFLCTTNDAAKDPAGAKYAHQPTASRRGAVATARFRHWRPQHPFHHRGAGPASSAP